MILLGLLLILIFLLFLKLIYFYYYSSPDQHPNTSTGLLKLPPGPWQLPVIGSLHHLLGSPLPHHSMRDLSNTYGPLMLLKLGQVPTLVVSSAEAAREIMKNHDVAFASRHLSVTLGIFSYGGQGILFTPYNDNWRRLRKICVLELFSPKRVQSFQFIREEEVARLIRSISAEASSDNKPVNLSEKIGILMNDTIVRAAIGSRCKHREEFLHELDAAVKLAGGFNLADLFPSSQLVRLLSKALRDTERCHHNLHRILLSIIYDHNNISEKEEDLLSVLLTLQKEGGLQSLLNKDTITAVIQDVFAAGSETSSTTLEWAMSELIRNPRVLKKAQSEVRQAFKGQAKLTEEDVAGKLSYMQLVVKETLRLHAPAPLLLPRECRETCQVMGYHIPKGTKVLVNVWAMGRDPKYWENAMEFKPERFEGSTVDFKGTDFEYIPFGAGRRICPGMSLGLANMELALASLLYHFDWELPDGMEPQQLDMTEAFGITARRKSKLFLLARPRIP